MLMYALWRCVLHALQTPQLRHEHEYCAAIWICQLRAGELLPVPVRKKLFRVLPEQRAKAFYDLGCGAGEQNSQVNGDLKNLLAANI